MPLTKKGEEIKESMEREYGKERGERVFYASRNKGTISGADELRKAADSGNAEAQRLMSGKHVSGRDRKR
jgi:hypothetical protein